MVGGISIYPYIYIRISSSVKGISIGFSSCESSKADLEKMRDESMQGSKAFVLTRMAILIIVLLLLSIEE